MMNEDAADMSTRYGHSQCLLCGSHNHRSLKLSFQAAEDGEVRAQFNAHSGLQGYDGFLHGGVIASVLDSAMTHCLFHKGIRAVTGDLHVRFVAPVQCGGALALRARVTTSYPPLYRLRSELLFKEKIMAWADAKFMRHEMP